MRLARNKTHQRKERTREKANECNHGNIDWDTRNQPKDQLQADPEDTEHG